MKLCLLVFLIPAIASAQFEVPHKSIHQIETELHQNDSAVVDVKPAAPASFLPKDHGAAALNAMVYGWHPYWASANAHLAYDYSALSHIAHFSCETDTATGGFTTTRGWETSPVISYARQRGVKVTITVTNFGYDSNDKLLSDTSKQERMFATLVSLLKARGGDGVNFDLEQIRSTQRANLVSFMRRAAARIKMALPDAEISMATPAVDWSGTWDFSLLAQICDYLIVMGYDYYWSGSSTAGPVAPLEGENYNVTRTVGTYLALGVPQRKLLLGVPWYGLDWPVQSPARKSPATGTASSRTYAVAEPMAVSSGKTIDQAVKVPWFSYQTGTTWRQVWYDDSVSLGMKYNLAAVRSLGGIGIWALSYEAGRSEIWNGIKAAFSVSGAGEVSAERPGQVVLYQNYPNPFNSSTVIRYTFGGPGSQGLGTSHVKLAVYDLLGREVGLLRDESQGAGTHEVIFDATRVPSGVYFCRLTAGRRVESRMMTLMK